MYRFLQRLYYYYFFTVFIGSFLIVFPVVWFMLRKPSLYFRFHQFRRKWAKVVLFVSGISYEVGGENGFDFHKTYVYTSNHTSPLDILAILAVFPGYYCFMAKAEYSKLPLFGMIFRTIDLAVDRSSPTKSATSYKKSVEALQSGKGLAIFPEGGILGKVPILQPFKDGPFDLAIRQKVPVLPFTFPDNWKLIPDDGSKLAKPGKIRIILHKPIETSEMAKQDTERLKDEVFDIIAADMARYC